MTALSYLTKTAFSVGNLADSANMNGKATATIWKLQSGGVDALIDNTGLGATMIDLQLDLGAISWAAGDYLSIYALPQIDGSGFAYAGGVINATGLLPPEYFLTQFIISQTTDAVARRLIRERIDIGFGRYNFYAYYKGANSLLGTGTANSLSYRAYTLQMT